MRRMKENLSSDEEALGDSSPAYIGTNQFLCLAGRHHSGDGGLPHQTPEHDSPKATYLSPSEASRLGLTPRP